MFVRMWPISSPPERLNRFGYFFWLAPSWSEDGFRPKKFRSWDLDFLEIRKNPVSRVLHDLFG